MPSSITVTPETVKLTGEGETAQLRATVLDQSNRTVLGANVVWSSSTTSVATVNSSGLVTAVQSGTTIITATSGGAVGQAAVTVEIPLPTMVIITPETASLTAVGQTVQLTAVVRDSLGRPLPSEPVTWSSGNDGVATVNSQGLVTAVGPGTAEISARSGNVTGTMTVSVMLRIHSIALTPSEAEVFEDDFLRVVAEATDANGRVVDAVFTWTSSNAAVATVDGRGLVRAIRNGNTFISAFSEGITGRARVSVIAGSVRDRSALVALYESTDGLNWTNNDGWLSNEPLKHWYGVETDSNGRVRSLDLTDNELNGPIPAEIGNMTKLIDLRLNINQLSGSIPPELGNLTNLVILFLSSNRLTGQIPPELGNLVNLRSLVLSSNELFGTIPQELTRLVELNTFYLPDRGVCAPLNVEMQEWLAGIASRLADNCLSQDRGILAAFYWATEGTNWTTSTGWLSDDPLRTWHGVKTGSDGRVTHLNLDNNSLNGNLITELATLDQIEELSLQSNALTGQIPLQLGRLGQLNILNLSDNDFKGTVPAELGDLTSLEELILESNPLAGPLPLTLSQLNHLQSLRADNTQLCAPISSGFQIWLDGIAETRVEDCENRDRIALTVLYNATDGSNWKNNTGWLTNEPLSDWLGVSISVDGLVTELKLAGNGLSGSIPAELTDLFNLSVLDLSNNSLTGRLPYEITRLGLESLRLDNTELCAPFDNRFQAWLEGIADRTVVNCENEERNALIALYHATDGSAWKNSDGWLSERPLHEWFGVTVDENGSVVRLDLEKNDLRGSIPSDLGSLSRLYTLNLSRNRLSGGIPSILGNLKELRELNLGQIKLGGTIPTELGSLEELRVLKLRSNGLIGEIPQELGNLRNLIELSLFDNELTGAIPPQIGKLTNLRYLDLSGNELGSSIPVEMGNLEHLEFLALLSNNLTGEIPASLGNLENLTSLNLNSNILNGAIPASFGELGKLRFLDLSDNNLNGKIPREIGMVYSLARLNVAENQLSGPIPPELGQLYRLYQLNLNLNQFSGEIPVELSKLRGLRILTLSSNNLLGSLPLAFIELPYLERLLLENTGLCVMPDMGFQEWLQKIEEKTIPPVCESPERNALVTLYKATGGANWTTNTGWLTNEPIGTWYGVLMDASGSVTGLTLESNNLLGSLPPEIGSLPNLVSLSLGSNSVSGQIPDDMGELLKMKKLDLSQNNLSGSIPAELGKLVQLERLDLGENELGGYVPRELVQLVNLNLLDLHGTHLCIPSDSVFQEWLQVVSDYQEGQCQTTDRDILVSLYHATNGPDWARQDGWLSDEPLQHWDNVETNESGRVAKLNFFYNGLIGHLPPELVFLSALETLILSGNRLSGQIPPGIESLTQLKSLLLDSNRLSGSIPPALGEITTLNVLTLHNNQFSGSIPTQLGNLTNLTLLSLASLDLSGSIPSELGKLSRLEELFLYENRLDGRIPRELGNLANLRNLNLRNNMLSGPIPSELGNLTELVNLWLNENQLSGTIPPQFAHLESLKYLGLHNNQALEGPLPTSFTKFAIEVLQLGGTRICTPPTEEFTVWLSEIGNQRVPVCESSTTVRAYLTQATQSLDYPVPLVAGKPALLRVFIADKEETGVSMPPLRATFYQRGMLIHTIDIPGRTSTVPVEIVEGRLSSSANMEVPASVIVPGLEMVIEIDPDGEWDTADTIVQRIPETGRIFLEVIEVPPLDLTLVPFLWVENPDRPKLDVIAGLTADDELFGLTKKVLPVQDFSLHVRDFVWTSVEPDAENRVQILQETQAIQAMDATGSFYMGILDQGGGAGIAYLQGTTSASVLRADVIAHELGHNMSLLHAPCFVRRQVDEFFPYQDGSIGSWGYDAELEALVPPDTWDLMSYCGPPKWISDYNFSQAIRFQRTGEVTTVIAGSASARSLLIWGGVTADGELVLEPAFVVDAAPFVPSRPGPYRIMGQDELGRMLFSVDFKMGEIADAEGGIFTFTLPVQPSWRDRLDRIILSGPEGEVTQDTTGDTAMALLRDASTGQIRGFLRDLPVSPSGVVSARRAPPEPGLEMVISRGVPLSSDW